MKPQIIAPDYGQHNAQLESSIARVTAAASWKKLDTVIIYPSGPTVPVKVAAAWLNLYAPPNNQIYRMHPVNCEIGNAYSIAIEQILAHPDLSKFKYILTIEADNIPPPDGLIKLQERMEAHPEFDCIGGLYWLKGPGGVAQIWGDPRDPTLNFRPQPPVAGQLVECCGTGNGFNLFRLEMFRDPDLRRPWFVTQKEAGVMTQDLYFWSDARRHGYRCAIDCSVLVGHYDLEGKFGMPDTVW